MTEDDKAIAESAYKHLEFSDSDLRRAIRVSKKFRKCYRLNLQQQRRIILSTKAKTTYERRTKK